MTCESCGREYPPEFLNLIEELGVPEISRCAAQGRERIGMLMFQLKVDKDDWLSLSLEFSKGFASADQDTRNTACAGFTERRLFLEKKAAAYRLCDQMMDRRYSPPGTIPCLRFV